MSQVQYQSLDRSKREIRLIVLGDAGHRDVAGTWTTALHSADPPLACELVTTSLDLYREPLRSPAMYAANRLRNTLARAFLNKEPPREFYALSYVWGDPVAACDLKVNGAVVKIGANLHAALQAVRQNTKFRVVWADALCINQSDPAEKSWQVQQMGAIYSRARATISWLGLPSVDSMLALDDLTELDRATSRFSWSVQEAEEGGPPVGQINKSILRLLAPGAHRWNAIADLCARPYWSRIWIFQEMACARERYFLCGDAIAKGINRPIALLLAWQAYQQHSIYQLGSEDHTYSISPSSGFQPLGARCLAMIGSVQTFRFFGDFPSDAPYYIRPGKLHDMLPKLNMLSSTEARDKIYAPLAIATDRERLRIVPDYTKTLEQIFKETAGALLRQGHIDVLVSAGLQERGTGSGLQLPSWVPDWSSDRLYPHVTSAYRTFHADKGLAQRESTLDAIPQSPDCVTLDGYRLGRVIRTYDPCPVAALEGPKEGTEAVSDAAASSSTFGDWLHQMQAAIFADEEESRVGTGNCRALSPGMDVTALLSCDPGPWPVFSMVPRSSDPYIRVYEALAAAKSVKSLVTELMNDGLQKKESRKLAGMVQRIYDNLATNPRPYRTDSGHVGIAWVGEDFVGNEIVIIPGVSMPCVLRCLPVNICTAGTATTLETGTGGSYQLVSPAYVYDAMQGEFFKRKNGAQLETFNIC